MYLKNVTVAYFAYFKTNISPFKNRCSLHCVSCPSASVTRSFVCQAVHILSFVVQFLLEFEKLTHS